MGMPREDSGVANSRARAGQDTWWHAEGRNRKRERLVVRERRRCRDSYGYGVVTGLVCSWVEVAEGRYYAASVFGEWAPQRKLAGIELSSATRTAGGEGMSAQGRPVRKGSRGCDWGDYQA